MIPILIAAGLLIVSLVSMWYVVKYPLSNGLKDPQEYYAKVPMKTVSGEKFHMNVKLEKM